MEDPYVRVTLEASHYITTVRVTAPGDGSSLSDLFTVKVRLQARD